MSSAVVGAIVIAKMALAEALAAGTVAAIMAMALITRDAGSTKAARQTVTVTATGTVAVMVTAVVGGACSSFLMRTCISCEPLLAEVPVAVGDVAGGAAAPASPSLVACGGPRAHRCLRDGSSRSPPRLPR